MKDITDDWQAIDPAEPMLDGRHHQIAHVVARDASRGGEEAHSLPITAVEREGDPHPLAIVAADLEAIGAPAPIAFIDRHTAVMPPLDAASPAEVSRRLFQPPSPLVQWFAVEKLLAMIAQGRRCRRRSAGADATARG